MEEKKTKKIDLVVVMAILILIAFIGVMSFAMVQGILQYTKKDAVAFADEVPVAVGDNLLRTCKLGYYNSSNGVNIEVGDFYINSYSYASGVDYPLFYYWCENNTSSTVWFNCQNQLNTVIRMPIKTTFTGLGFDTIYECGSGTYSFGIQVFQVNSNITYDLRFYSYDFTNGAFTQLDSNAYPIGNSGIYSVTFTATSSFNNLFIAIRNISSGNITTGTEIRPFSVSLYSGSHTFTSNELDMSSYSNVYQDGFTTGYYTGYAAASPSDDGGDQFDIVGNNLFEYQFNQPWDDTYAKLVRNGDTYKGWKVHSSGSAMYNYDEVNSLSVFKYYGSSVSYNYDFYYYLDDFDSGDYTFTFNYDYGDIDAHDFKLLALTFTIPETDPESEETLAYIQDDNADVTLTATYYQGRYLISISCMLSSSADLICRYAKLETGSNFTGFVPLDYYNYGYNQGYQNGQGDLLGSRNYILLDYLAFYGSTRNLTSDFVFNDTNYVYGDWTEDLNSVYNYNNPNFAIIDSLDGAPSGSQVGYKYENENLYGDILLMMPYCDDNLRVVFEVVDSGEVLITSPRDTVHWTLNSHLGNVNGQASWSCDLYTIHFYSPTQVNIYFLPYQPLDYGTEALYLPLNTKSWRVYSTQTNSALSSFDDGYLKGLDQGKEQQAEQDATLIARAKGIGYEEGRRDALEDTSDYTFMGLIGSVIDAPINSFRGLLNFSILGVNMQSFVLAILTLCVIIIVIKIALGGR